MPVNVQHTGGALYRVTLFGEADSNNGQDWGRHGTGGRFPQL